MRQHGHSVVRAFALRGMTALAVVGGVVGLLVGLSTYPPTAWFAAIELGLPAALLGLGLGAALGAITAAKRARRIPA